MNNHRQDIRSIEVNIDETSQNQFEQSVHVYVGGYSGPFGPARILQWPS